MLSSLTLSPHFGHEEYPIRRGSTFGLAGAAVGATVVRTAMPGVTVRFRADRGSRGWLNFDSGLLWRVAPSCWPVAHSKQTATGEPFAICTSVTEGREEHSWHWWVIPLRGYHDSKSLRGGKTLR